MKRIYSTIIALIATLTISAQTIKVYEYDENGNLNNSPAYTSSKKVKVIFTEDKQEEHEWVDLGLPSGTLWATCNVGASKPEEYGDYFAWGETSGYNSGKTTFNWSTYKWMNTGQSSWTEINKYTYADGKTSGCWYSNGIFIGDGKTTLESSDDAATINWGSAWCMPSFDQIKELYNSSYTTTEWIRMNGVNGRKITSKSNGKSLFLPAAGYHDYDAIELTCSSGYYWSSSLYPLISHSAISLCLHSDGIDYFNNARINGLSVRPVRAKE